MAGILDGIMLTTTAIQCYAAIYDRRGLLKFYKDGKRNETDSGRQPLIDHPTEKHNSTDAPMALALGDNPPNNYRSQEDIEIFRKAEAIKYHLACFLCLGTIGAVFFACKLSPYPKNCSKLFKAYLGFNNGVDVGNVIWLLSKVYDHISSNISRCYDTPAPSL